MPDVYDVAVLGSGAGGLAAALTVARAGRSVLVLEAARDLGGMLNPFSRRRYEFDVGIHYLGQAGPGQPMRRLLDRMELTQVQFREIDPNCIDRYVFDGYESRLVKGIDAYVDRLIQDFPNERRGLDHFRSLLMAVSAVHRVMAGRASARDYARLARHTFDLPGLVNGTYGALTVKLFKEPLLRAAVSGPLGDIGLPPSRASAVAALMVLLHYMEGAYYPIGGSGPMRDAFVTALEGRGATLKTKALVTRIVRVGDAWEVHTDDGVYRAGQVISNIDAVDTIAMVQGATPDGHTRNRAANTRPSLGSVCVFIGTDLDLPAAGITDANIWHFGTPDIDGLYAPLFEGKLAERPAFFLTAPTLKDPGTGRAPPGRHTLEIVSFGPTEPFREHFDEAPMRRAERYQAQKAQLTEQLIDGAAAYVPGLKDHLEVVESATPATVWSYVRGRNGGIYGPEHTPDQVGWRRFRTGTGLPGLHLAGASVLGCGVYPCLLSGVIAGKAAIA